MPVHVVACRHSKVPSLIVTMARISSWRRPFFGHSSSDGCFVRGLNLQNSESYFMSITRIRLVYEHISLSLSLFPFLNKVNTMILPKTFFFSNRKNPNAAIAGTEYCFFLNLHPFVSLTPSYHSVQILHVRKIEQKGRIFRLLQDS